MKNKAVLYVGADGHKEEISPFGIWDAYRIGRLTWKGDTAALKDMYLFDRKVLPLLEQELRAPNA